MLKTICLILILLVVTSGGSHAATGKKSSAPARQRKGPTPGASPSIMMNQWLLKCPGQCVDAKAGDYADGLVEYGPNGEVSRSVAAPSLPPKTWPILLPGSPVTTDERTAAWLKEVDRATGFSRPEVGSAGLTPSMMAVVGGITSHMVANQLQSPQAIIPRAREEQNQQMQQTADNFATLERSQSGCAIDFVSSFLKNFTVDGNNIWNRLRNQIFVPMAFLLLLPGAVLAQLKATSGAGLPFADETSPFDGLIRAVVAVFLIPATSLVVNYGIDVSNAISSAINTTYTGLFNENMYSSAFCAHIRAFPFRQPAENKNYIPSKPAQMGPIGPNRTPFAVFEGNWLAVKIMDPCANLNIVPEDRTNEQVPYAVNAQRAAYNGFNATLAMTWNVLCAFQMVYLYYLWFVGPLVAAFWVFPSRQLRAAFPSWLEGVVTVCLWSLFWQTIIVLMSIFRGVDETGTITVTALNLLATVSVKCAFDFAGLVSSAASELAQAVQQESSGGSDGGQAPRGHGKRHRRNHSTGTGANGVRNIGAQPLSARHAGPAIQTASGDKIGHLNETEGGNNMNELESGITTSASSGVRQVSSSVHGMVSPQTAPPPTYSVKAEHKDHLRKAPKDMSMSLQSLSKDAASDLVRLLHINQRSREVQGGTVREKSPVAAHLSLPDQPVLSNNPPVRLTASGLNEPVAISGCNTTSTTSGMLLAGDPASRSPVAPVVAPPIASSNNCSARTTQQGVHPSSPRPWSDGTGSNHSNLMGGEASPVPSVFYKTSSMGANDNTKMARAGESRAMDHVSRADRKHTFPEVESLLSATEPGKLTVNLQRKALANVGYLRPAFLERDIAHRRSGAMQKPDMQVSSIVPDLQWRY